MNTCPGFQLYRIPEKEFFVKTKLCEVGTLTSMFLPALIVVRGLPRFAGDWYISSAHEQGIKIHRKRQSGNSGKFFRNGYLHELPIIGYFFDPVLTLTIL